MKGWLANAPGVSKKLGRGNGARSRKRKWYYSRYGGGARGRKYQGNHALKTCCPCHPPYNPRLGARRQGSAMAKEHVKDAPLNDWGARVRFDETRWSCNCCGERAAAAAGLTAAGLTCGSCCGADCGGECNPQNEWLLQRQHPFLDGIPIKCTSDCNVCDSMHCWRGRRTAEEQEAVAQGGGSTGDAEFKEGEDDWPSLGLVDALGAAATEWELVGEAEDEDDWQWVTDDDSDPYKKALLAGV